MHGLTFVSPSVKAPAHSSSQLEEIGLPRAPSVPSSPPIRERLAALPHGDSNCLLLSPVLSHEGADFLSIQIAWRPTQHRQRLWKRRLPGHLASTRSQRRMRSPAFLLGLSLHCLCGRANPQTHLREESTSPSLSHPRKDELQQASPHRSGPPCHENQTQTRTERSRGREQRWPTRTHTCTCRRGQAGWRCRIGCSR